MCGFQPITDLINSIKEQINLKPFNTIPTVILVLVNGRALCIEEHVNNCAAVIESWEPGEFGGKAIAEVIYGKTNPSGKLPVTFPRHEGQLPVYYNHKSNAFYARPVDVEPTPLFWFGHGLSYSTFVYSDLVVEKEHLEPGESLSVTATITNESDIDGDEVVMLYTRDNEASNLQPVRQLQTYQRIHLKAHESKTIKLTVPYDRFIIYNNELDRVHEKGSYSIYVDKLKGKFSI